MTVVGVDEAGAQLPRLLREVAEGGEVVLESDGRPVARIVAFEPRRREFGFDRGKIWMSEDFDDPLPEMAPYS